MRRIWIEVDAATALKELATLFPGKWPKMNGLTKRLMMKESWKLMEIDGNYYETLEIENFINKELGKFNLAR